MLKTKNKLYIKLSIEEVIDHEAGIHNVPIFKRSQLCTNLKDVHSILDSFVKDSDTFISTLIGEKEKENEKL